MFTNTGEDTGRAAVGGGAVTRASFDMGHMRYNAKGSPSTQGSCNPHHALSIRVWTGPVMQRLGLGWHHNAKGLVRCADEWVVWANEPCCDVC